MATVALQEMSRGWKVEDVRIWFHVFRSGLKIFFRNSTFLHHLPKRNSIEEVNKVEIQWNNLQNKQQWLSEK
jgi:hypothetical protein